MNEMIDPMEEQQVFDALEATAMAGKKGNGLIPRANATRRDISNTRNQLLRFLEEIDGSMSVAEVREHLENYE